MPKYLSLLLVLLFLSSFSEKNKSDYRVECQSYSEGFQTINIWNLSQKRKYKVESASKDAVHAFLFSGTESSKTCNLTKPLLYSEQEKENFKTIEKSFFKFKYLEFVRMSSINSEIVAKINGVKFKIYSVSVSKDLLRKYIEEQKIIKSLNNGF